uniref:PB1 domain-containing protein n=1 Tax=Davidia involucrata TaxID=16924 RepID=A0A5B7BFR5_DAVIN
MAAEGGGGGGEETTSGVIAAESPKNRVKFLCSQGGKILPRPADGHLKYVGGETRVVSVPRDITLSELMKKITNLLDGEMLLKYQLAPEDLDALVSVKSDEDLRHMFDEYDRYENTGTPKLRAFLFTANPIVAENHFYSMDALQQRYIDAINGIFRSSTTPLKHIYTNHLNRTSYSVSSADTSPKSPDSYVAIDSSNYEAMILNGYQNGRIHLHKVQSSPNVSSLNGQHQNHHHTTQHHHHHYHQQYRQHHQHGYQPIRTPPAEPHKGGAMPERLISVRSVGRADSWRYQAGQNPNHYYSPSRHSRGSGWCSKCMYTDEHCAYMDRRIDREHFSESPPPP